MKNVSSSGVGEFNLTVWSRCFCSSLWEEVLLGSVMFCFVFPDVENGSEVLSRFQDSKGFVGMENIHVLCQSTKSQMIYKHNIHGNNDDDDNNHNIVYV